MGALKLWNIQSNTSWVVVKGCNLIEGIDFFDTFSHYYNQNIACSCFHIKLALALILAWRITGKYLYDNVRRSVQCTKQSL